MHISLLSTCLSFHTSVCCFSRVQYAQENHVWPPTAQCNGRTVFGDTRFGCLSCYLLPHGLRTLPSSNVSVTIRSNPTMPSEVRGEVSTGPQVRNACEECHSRKIRCHSTSDGGCRACQNSGRLCFFLPRNKSGRPKVGQDRQKGSKQANPSIGATAVAAVAAIAEYGAMPDSHASGSQSVPPDSQQSRPRLTAGSTRSPTGSSRSISQQSVTTSMIRPASLGRSMSDTDLNMAFPILVGSADWHTQPFVMPQSDPIDVDLESSFQFHDVPSADNYFDFYGMDTNMTNPHNQDFHSTTQSSLNPMGTSKSLSSVNSSGSMSDLGSMPSNATSMNLNFSHQSGPTSFFPSTFTSRPVSPTNMPSNDHQYMHQFQQQQHLHQQQPPPPSPTEQQQFKQSRPEGCFSFLLGHISRLQRCHEKVRSGVLFSYAHTRDNQLKMVVSTIDAGCIATCSTLKDQFELVLGQRAKAKEIGMNRISASSDSQHSARSSSTNTNVDFARPDHSLIALAITTILTIARLCQALVHGELPDVQSSLDNMLLYKRLGCNILQTRIALDNIERLDPGLAYLIEDAKKEIGVVQTEFENPKVNG